MPSNPVVSPLLLDLIGVFAFALSGGLVAVRKRLERLSRLVKVLDAVGLALFAVGGALLALARPGIPPLAAIIVGTITAVGGGALRDVLVGQVPEVLRRELYALPALLGSTIVVVAYYVGFISPLVVWGVAALVFGIRMVAIVLHLNAPQPFRLGDPR